MLAFGVCKAYVPGMNELYINLRRGRWACISSMVALCVEQVLACIEYYLFPMATHLVNWTELVERKKQLLHFCSEKARKTQRLQKWLSRAHGVGSARHGRRRGHLWSFSRFDKQEMKKSKARAHGGPVPTARPRVACGAPLIGQSARREVSCFRPVRGRRISRACRKGDLGAGGGAAAARRHLRRSSRPKWKLPKAGQDSITVLQIALNLELQIPGSGTVCQRPLEMKIFFCVTSDVSEGCRKRFLEK